MSRVRADKYTNSAANGAPEFTHGVRVTGVITATSFSGDGIQVGIVTATTTVNSNQYEGFLWVDSSLFT
tara:strand:- start:7872 stop:8078 length:207 start_codon:yes stop_codon:yes gene_type:complete